MKFEAWEDPNRSLTLTTAELAKKYLANGLLSADAKLLYEIDAATWEEACTIHHQKQGWEPYKPMEDK